jgi:DNA-binding NtrC family response regulator
VHVLIVSAGDESLKAIRVALRRRRATMTEAGSLAEALAVRARMPVDLIVLERACDASAEQTAAGLLEACPSARLLAVGPADAAATAVALMKLGAVDYLTLPLEEGRAGAVLDALLVDLPAAEASAPGACTDDEVLSSANPPIVFIGQSSAAARVRQMVRQVAAASATALVYGETGTGKEIVARAIHRLRHGLAGPFVAVNCAQMSGGIMESQLFGHVKGAFTGAMSDNLGFFRAAEGGTLFLDEVSEMSAELQAKLLRALQEREVIPVGSARPIAVRVDIIAATNRDPARALAEGLLRKDLYYRLAEVGIYLPPLRERAGDVPRLVRWFIGRFAKTYGDRPKRIEPGVLDLLARHDWPGNVRELESVVHRLFTFDQGGAGFLKSFVAEPVSGLARPSGGSAALDGRPRPRPDDRGTALTRADVVPLNELERRAIAQALTATGGNQSQAARLLGIERHRLARRIRAHGLRSSGPGAEKTPGVVSPKGPKGAAQKRHRVSFSPRAAVAPPTDKIVQETLVGTFGATGA